MSRYRVAFAVVLLMSAMESAFSQIETTLSTTPFDFGIGVACRGGVCGVCNLYPSGTGSYLYVNGASLAADFRFSITQNSCGGAILADQECCSTGLSFSRLLLGTDTAT